MAAETLREVILAAAKDRSYRDRLATDPEGALAGSGLTAEERAAVTALAGSPAEGRADGRSRTAPSSFKEIGALVLSAVVVVVFAVVLIATLARLNDNPRGVEIGSALQTVDPWSRAKDLLSTVFPLLGAVVTFWLGIAVEGRRAEDNKASADRATEGRRLAESREARTNAVARDALRGAKAALRESAPRQQFETRVGTSTTSTGPGVESALAILDDAERRLSW